MTLHLNGSITTGGDEANAVLAHSVGGFAGDAGAASGFVAYGAGSESAGDGASVGVFWTGDAASTLKTTSEHADGVFAQSQGGGGGKGSSGSGIVSLAGSGSAGGDGGHVEVETEGATIETSGERSRAIFAQSAGGGGGDGGGAKGIVSIGGSGSKGGSGGTVIVSNTSVVSTEGFDAQGIFAQSIGGGGGSAASTSGIAAIGGNGGSGATGGSVTVTNVSNITTVGDNADAIFAQSQGGGGGRAANSLAIGESFSMAIGGTGGTGGHGGTVVIHDFLGSHQPTLMTSGDTARGVVAQSVGGGGGHGGNAISLSGSPNLDVSIAVGGSGGAAGDGGPVNANFDGKISTKGDHSVGVMATSTGGTGGSAGTTVSVANGAGTISLGVGGSGSGGGDGGAALVCRGVRALSSGNCIDENTVDSLGIETQGDSAHGVLAASAGGGGGHSGLSIAGSPTGIEAIDVDVGGSGGAGGAGDSVFVYSSGGITTSGQAANGILAKSVGSGGGAAYVSAAASTIGASDINVGVGGKGGTAGGAGDVTVVSVDTIETTGSLSDAILAISSSGSGGAGGVALAGDGVTGGNVGVAVGGAGGGGTTAGDVEIDWSGATITTSGSQSLGLSAASTGGSGGRGGLDINGSAGSLGAVQVSVGGAGGNGGTGGKATVTSGGAITTKGSMSPAISATSGGGNGGRGGASISSTLGSQGKVAVTLGGGGGNGGQADAVMVTNSGAIQTEGSNSEGVFAQSQGGNGGVGGWVAEGGITTTAVEGVPAGDLTVSLGGDGGTGGKAGTVGIANSGQVTARNFGSAGLFAQSIGGQGGQGGAVYSGEINLLTENTFDVAVSVGGSGGKGASGNAVTISNTGAVTTKDGDSAAVFAQSVGGDGGKGGASYNVLANVNAQSMHSATVQVTVGGSGGAGATPGAVTVDNAGALSTAGTSSAGVYAQAVGGDGGAGGSGGNMLFNLGKAPANSQNTINASVEIAVGGSGGTGGSAADVEVTNHAGATIETTGETSSGIFAQAVGGGGGDGGAASGYSLSITGACSLTGAKTFSYQCRQSNGTGSTTTYAFNGNIGGSGGAGGNGAAVTASNSGSISTTGTASPGILAQSVGGGGGTGGAASTGIGAFTSNAIAADIATALADATKLDPYSALTSWTSFSLSLGGKGGAAGDATVVTVANDHSISTSGASSHGISAQSIGGGGGAGGAAASAPVHSLSIGGSGSGGGNGGTVNVAGGTGAEITTAGDAALGILAQSVGGGGGDSGNKKSLVLNPQLNIGIGGTAGVSGTGGMVTIDNVDTTITTGGTAASAIFAQSIGGGGGLALDGLDGGSGTVTVGGSGKSQGFGGNVNVTHTGTIRTAVSATVDASNAAHGIFAQSVGGGGGYAGSVVMGPSSNVSNNLPIAPDTDTSGKGGAVTVSASGDITTHGGSSVGIFAQSVGGGGGVAGVADASSETGALIGNGGGSGTGGSVTVTYGAAAAGTLTTSGPGAHGIFAQSVGGPGTSTSTDTKVSVTAASSIFASGAGAHGIFAQSAGDGIGPIEVAVDTGATVQGGAAATIPDAEDGAGIFVKGGTSGSITNQGTIASVLGQDGIAINILDTDVVVENSGTVTGQILKASSEVRMRNTAGGTIDAGPLLDVDRLLNYGLLAVDSGTIGATQLTGDLAQGPDGVLRFDLDPSRTRVSDRSDRLTIEGDATLDGRMGINVIDPWQPVAGRQSVPLLEAWGDLAADELEVIPSAAGQYRLERPDTASLGVSYDIDFANEGILAATNDNQDMLATHLHRTYREQALDRDAALALIAIEDAEAFARVMNTLGAEVAIDNQITSLLSGIRFGDALLSCAESTGQYRFLDDGQCGWVRFGGETFERRETGDNAGFDVNGWQIAGGGQVDLGEGWNLGGAIAYEGRNLSVNDSDASSEGSQVQAGISAKRLLGATELSGSFAVGYGNFDIERDPLPGISLGGTQQLWQVSGQLRAAHLIERGRWSLKPRIDLGIDYLSMDGFRESGPNGLGLRVDDSHDTYFSLQPAIDIATDFEDENGVLYRPKLSLGITRFLGDAAPSVTGRLASAPGDVDFFTASTELDRTRFDIAAGIDIFTTDDIVVRAAIGGSFAEHSQLLGATLKVEMPF